MRLKTFTAKDITEAMSMVRREMGPDAVIVATTKTRRGNVEVRAATDGPMSGATIAPEDVAPPRPTGDVQKLCVSALFHHAVPDTVAVALAANAAQLERAEPVAALARALETWFTFVAPTVTTDRPVMVVGTPGVGKTSTAARLAARATLGGAATDLVCADPDREASRAQIEVYADVLGAYPVEAGGPAALAAWARQRDDTRAAIIDSPSVNPFDDRDMDMLAGLIKASGAEPVLVFDAGSQPHDLAEQAQLFAELGVRRAITVKCDIARRVGGVLAVANEDIALTAMSASPYVASGLTPVTPLRLSRLLLDNIDLFAATGEDPDRGSNGTDGEWR